MTVDEQGSVAIRTPDQRLRVFVSSVSAKRSHSYALHKTGASTNAEGPQAAQQPSSRQWRTGQETGPIATGDTRRR
jgi:hypothetical protein